MTSSSSLGADTGGGKGGRTSAVESSAPSSPLEATATATTTDDPLNFSDPDFYNERRETWFTCVVDMINPMSYVRYVSRTSQRTVRVCASFSRVRFVDVISGLVLGILMGSFAAVYATTILDEAGLDDFIGLGGGPQMVSVIVTGLAHIFFSDVGVSVACPDLNPAILLSNMAILNRNLMDAKANAITNSTAGAQDQAVLATTLACIIISTMALGVIVWGIGRLRFTRAIQMLPDAVLTGFMASIGYLILHKAFRTSMPVDVWLNGPVSEQWWQFVSPGVLFGFALYLRDRFDPFNPAITMPILMLIPLITFFIVVYATGSNVDTVRAKGWFFPILTYYGPGVNGQYDASYGSADLVDWAAVGANVPNMLLFWVVITLDILLKIAGVRRALFATQLNFDHEMMLAGKANFVSGFFVGTPGYNQPVLTVVNRSIVKNQWSRLPGLIAVLFNFILFVVGYPVVNFLPRFWLAGLVFYAAIGFIIDNLFESRKRLSLKEYFAVWVIVVVNALVGLGWSLLAGVCISAFIFAIAYGRVGSIKSVTTAADMRSGVTRSLREDKMLQHLAKSCLVVILHRYIFFGSASQVIDMVQGLIEEQRRLLTPSRRLKYYIFDFTEVEDIDNTSMGVLIEAIAKIRGPDNRSINIINSAYHINTSGTPTPTVIFTGLSYRQRRIMMRAGVLPALYEKEYRKIAKSIKTAGDGEDSGSGPSSNSGSRANANENANALPVNQRRVFESLDIGLEWVEERLLERAHEARSRWMRVEAFERLHEDAIMVARKDDENALGGGAKYFERIDVPKGSTLWRAGDFNPQLYFLQSGRLTAYGRDKQGNWMRKQSLRKGAFFNEESLYLESPVANTLVAEADSTVLALSREAMRKLIRDHPTIANDIHNSVMRHAARTRGIVRKAKEALDLRRSAFSAAFSDSGPLDADALNRGLRAGKQIAKRVAKSMGAAGLISTASASAEERRTALPSSASAVRASRSANRNRPAMTSHTSSLRSLATQNAMAATRHFSTVSRLDQLDERIKIAWMQYVPEGVEGVMRAGDISRALPGGASEYEASEMIWEADLNERGAISFFDLLDSLTSVYEGELVEPEGGQPRTTIERARGMDSSFQIDSDI